jgi:hypothetical protein
MKGTNLGLAASDLCPRTLFISVPECDIGHSIYNNNQTLTNRKAGINPYFDHLSVIHEDIEPILHAQVVLEIVKHSKHNVGTVLKIGIHRCFLYDYALHHTCSTTQWSLLSYKVSKMGAIMIHSHG